MVLLQGLFFYFSLTSPANLAAQTTTAPSVDNIIGINTRPSDKTPLLSEFNHIRSYHFWADDIGFALSANAKTVEDWLQTPTNANAAYLKYKYNVSFNNSSRNEMDKFYSKLHARVSPSLQSIAPAMCGINQFANWEGVAVMEQKPVNIGVTDFNWNGNANNTIHTPTYAQLALNHDKPLSYRSHALNMTMFTARYGKTVFPIAPAANSDFHERFIKPHLTSEELFPNLTGLGAIKYIESYNEPEKEWRDTPQAILEKKTIFRMWPNEYAAMLSADYDGHCRHADFKIQPPVAGGQEILLNGQPTYLGVKNTDPNMKMVMAGLADLRGGYIEEMLTWCNTNRGTCPQKIPFDVINVHHYSTVNSMNAPFADIYEKHATTHFGGGGVSPEEDQLKNKLRYLKHRLFNFASTNSIPLTGKELWLSEFGYDTEPNALGSSGNSATLVPAISGQSRQRTQAQWLMRSLLEIAASKVVGRADIFDLRDDLTGGTGQFGTSGLLNRYFEPKESWYFVQTLRHVLKGYEYAGTYINILDNAAPSAIEQLLSQGEDENGVYSIQFPSTGTVPLKIYKFTSGVKTIYAIWSPTSNGVSVTIPSITLKFPNTIDLPKLQNSKIVTPRTLDIDGKWNAIPISNVTFGTLSTGENVGYFFNLTISETPIFLVINDNRLSVAPRLPIVTAHPLCCNDVELRITPPTPWLPTDGYYYRVYYAPSAASGTTLDITDPDVRQFEYETGGYSSITVTGLLPNTNYRFWVVPESKRYISINPEVIMKDIPDVISSILTATTSNCNGTGNTACLYNVNAVGNNIETNYAQTQTEMVEILKLNTTDVCSSVGSSYSNEWHDWNWVQGAALPQVTMNFAAPIDIKSFYFFDGSGQGRLKIEYQDCCPNVWQLFAIVDLDKYQQWTRLWSLKNKVTKVRLTKLDADAKISRFYICAQPSVTACSSGDITAIVVKEPGETQPKAERVDARSADIEWEPMAANKLQPEQGNVLEYTLIYRKIADDLGNPVSETFKSALITSEAYGEKITQPLLGLSPNSKYEVKLTNGTPSMTALVSGTTLTLGGNNCDPFSYRVVSTNFNTLPEEREGGGKENEKLLEQPGGQNNQDNTPSRQLRVYPNPSMQYASVILPSEGFEYIEVIENATGRTVLDKKLDAQVTQWTFQVSQLFGGSYTVKAHKPNERVQTTQLIVVKD